MNTKEYLKEMLEDFSDEDLQKELDRRAKVKRGKVLGYRAICHGDTYNYGSFGDYLITEKMSKEDAKKAAEKCVKESENGGRIEVIYKHNLKKTSIVY